MRDDCAAFECLTQLASSCDEAGAIDVLRGLASSDAKRAVSCRDQGSGYTILHYACQFGLVDLIREVLAAGCDVDAVSSKDLVLQNKIVQSGGQSALHVACANGEEEAAALVSNAGADRSLQDWDGFMPGHLAYLAGRQDMSFAIRPDQSLKEKASAARIKRAELLLAIPAHLSSPYTLKSVLSENECDRCVADLVSTVAARGGCWSTDRHFEFATTDLAAKNLLVHGWLCSALEDRLFPLLRERHGATGLKWRDLFLAKYSANQQSDLALHRDATPLSFNILLNNPDHFEGGGTYFEKHDKTYFPKVGDCLVHSGKLRHGAGTVTSGHRFVLVAFVHVDSLSE